MFGATRRGVTSHGPEQSSLKWIRWMALAVILSQLLVAAPASASTVLSTDVAAATVATAPQANAAIPAAPVESVAPRIPAVEEAPAIEAIPASVFPPAIEQAAEPAAAGPDCSNPPPGQKALLVGEDEIVVACRSRDDHKSLETINLNNSGSNLVENYTKIYSSSDALSDVRSPTIAMGDLNNDGKYEMVMAQRDKSERISVLTSAAGSALWNMSGGAYDGGDVSYIDVATGNLDKANSDDEVAVTFRDDSDDPRLIVLQGDAGGGIANASGTYTAMWHDDQGGRGKVYHNAVAVGDIDGDGYDNEIVLVFKDGNSDLEALIFRLDGSALTLLWSKTWTNEGRGNVADDAGSWGNQYPIDVTTGDFDDDKRDEVMIGFRVGDEWHGSTQLLSLHFTGADTKNNTNPADDTFSMDDRVFLTEELSGHYAMAAQSVSLGAGDMDGDGLDEIAFGTSVLYADSDHDERTWQQHLSTYDYVPVTSPDWASAPCKDTAGNIACIRKRAGTWNSDTADVPMFVSEQNVEGDVRVAVGDIDGDGFDEAALIRQKHSTGDAWVFSFDADSKLSQRGSYTITWNGDDRVEEFWLAMGDKDGDARYGTYTGQCREKKQAQIGAVIHAPPFWPNEESPNYDEAEAGFGVNVGEGGGTGKATETSTSNSVGFSQEIGKEKWPINFGASFSYEWEKGTSVENTSQTTAVDGTKFKTHVPWAYGEEETYFDAIEFVESRYWCYDYTEATYGTMSVCIPRPPSETTVLNYPLNWWYEDGPETYPDSWVPVGINLAQGRTATQSTDLNGGVASKGVDGNIDGNFADGSVTSTGYDTNAWWEVDLGGDQDIDAVQIWNRTDCCYDRTADFYVFISSEPFTTRVVDTLLDDPNVWAFKVKEQAGRPTTVPVGTTGRYVRVELEGKNNLNMAEVQVYGRPGSVDLWPTTKPVTSTTSSFLLNWPDGKQQSVEGQIIYTRKGVQLGVRPRSGAADFDIGLSSDGEQVNESSTSQSYTLGTELKFKGGSSPEYERSWGSTDKTSYILSWSKDLELSGAVGGLGESESVDLSYAFMPYVWLQRASTLSSIHQAFVVLDYWVPEIGGDVTASSPGPAMVTAAGVTAAAPLAPEVTSTTHPDENWYASSNATLSWSQPGGDPAVISGYRWYLDHTPDTVPASVSPVLSTTFSYTDLADGVWYLHVHARDNSGQWSETTHRTVRVDVDPPTVELSLTPAQPSGDNGWYNTPVVATIAATDKASGVASMEWSQDGSSWTPYADPITFASDTTGITLYARATDGIGHVSQPITTTFRIDQTPPDSHVASGEGPGALVAHSFTMATGQRAMVLAGSIADATSGRSGMAIGSEGLGWSAAHAVGEFTSALPEASGATLQVNWYYTSTEDLGAGNHEFLGAAKDVAGNHETPYLIAQVVQFPDYSPELGGSSVTASPLAVRPGDSVTVTIVARNAGWQEALVAVTDTLPAGLTPIAGTWDSNATPSADSTTLVWAPHLLRPGEHTQYSFRALVGASVAAGTLEQKVVFHGFWPNVNDLASEADRKRFTDLEKTTTINGAVVVDPTLAAGADKTPPWVTVFASKKLVTDPVEHLSILSTEDALWMYIREWSLNPMTGNWTVSQNSGWVAYQPEIDVALSEGHGVKYLGVWVMDAAGNTSTLDEGSLVFSNRVDGAQALASGGRVQYRAQRTQDTWIAAELDTIQGDPDMFVWKPTNGYGPDLSATASVDAGQSEDLSGYVLSSNGIYLLEVGANGDSQYAITFMGLDSNNASVTSSAVTAKTLPQHPLAISDPLSAGLARGVNEDLKLYYHLPLIFNK